MKIKLIKIKNKNIIIFLIFSLFNFSNAKKRSNLEIEKKAINSQIRQQLQTIANSKKQIASLQKGADKAIQKAELAKNDVSAQQSTVTTPDQEEALQPTVLHAATLQMAADQAEEKVHEAKVLLNQKEKVLNNLISELKSIQKAKKK